MIFILFKDRIYSYTYLRIIHYLVIMLIYYIINIINIIKMFNLYLYFDFQLMRQLHPTTELNEFLDNKIHSECVSSTCPSDNGNKLIEQADPKLSRRPSSPFNNGLTEVLICKDGTESNNRLKVVDETIEPQNRRVRLDNIIILMIQ